MFYLEDGELASNSWFEGKCIYQEVSMQVLEQICTVLSADFEIL